MKLKKLIQEYDVKTTRDVKKFIFRNNSRNRYRNKNVKSDFGQVGISIPRYGEGSFEPRAIKNYENDIFKYVIFKKIYDFLLDEYLFFKK